LIRQVGTLKTASRVWSQSRNKRD